MFVSWKTELDEPLAIEQARRVFKKLDAPSVVLDKVVVGDNDISDSPLGIGVGNPHLDFMEVVPVDTWNSGLVASRPSKHLFEEVSDKSGVVSVEVDGVKGSVQRPVRLINVEYLTQSAVASGHHTRGLRLRDVVVAGDP